MPIIQAHSLVEGDRIYTKNNLHYKLILDFWFLSCMDNVIEFQKMEGSLWVCGLSGGIVTWRKIS